ncbi:MAG: PD-(D/E)XK nuclease family protein [Lachnospiraceae bacterium]|nr:PD-(D/E)XK nuclease family protein [Lachnospiraceae bacterium]
MALHFIIGNSAKQVRRELLAHMVDRSGDDGGETFFFVPEQANLDAERSLTSLRDGGCVMDIDIVSFRRLLHRLKDELGDRIPTILDDVGKSLLLRRVLSEHASELPRFGSKANKPGFVEEIKSLLSEFVRYEVSSEALSEASKGTEDELLADKLGELSHVYRWFREKCGVTQITEDDIYNAMCPLVRESARLHGSTLYFDGYTGFTPTQYNLVGELMRVCRDIYITVVVDPAEITGETKTACFRMSHDTIRQMSDRARDNGQEIAPMTIVKDEDEDRSPALTYLSSALFRRGKASYAGANAEDAIRLVSAESRENEVRYAATEIARLVREENVAYREIGIVCGDVEGYGEYLRRVFDTAGIPFFLDRTAEVTDNCLVDYVRSLLRMLYTDMRTDCCMRWLKNPINGYDEDSLNYLENYLIARGVRGLSMWKRGLTGNYGGRRVTRAEDCITFAKQIFEEIEPLADVMTSAQTSVQEKTEALYTFLAKRGVYERLLAMSEEIAKEPVPWNLRRAAEYRAVYRAVIELLDRLYVLLPEPKIALREYMDILDAGFSELRLGVIPPAPDSVMIGDCKRSRLSGTQYLFFLGVNEGIVPGSGHGSDLLNSRERELLADKFKITLADTEKESVDSEEYNILMVLQKPSKQLTLSWSRSDADGKKLPESYVIRRVRRLFPQIAEMRAEGRAETFFERIAVDGGLEELLARYRDAANGGGEQGEDRAALRTLYTWYCDGGADGEARLAVSPDVLRDAEQGAFCQPELSEEVAGELYPDDMSYSVSRLQNYAECPFKHFVKYGLTVEERETYEPSQLDNGNLYHKILEYTGQKAAEIGAAGRTPRADEMVAFVQEGADLVHSDPEFECFFENNRSRHLFDSIVRNLTFVGPAIAKQLMQGQYRVEKTEEKFVEQLGGISFTGKIDRVDRSDEGGTTYIKVVDYKTSGKEFKRELAVGGVDIQLPLYLRIKQNGLQAEGIVCVPAAALYMPLTADYTSGVPVDGNTDAASKKLRPDGAMVVESLDEPVSADHYLTQLDVNFSAVQGSYRSDVIPLYADKQGVIKGNGAITDSDMKALLDEVERVALDEVKRIRRGDVQVRPYLYGKGTSMKTGCDYCKYQGMCRNEPGAPVPYRSLNAGGAGGTEDDDEEESV